MMSIDGNQDLFKALEIVALVYQDDGQFILAGDVPEWFRKLCPEALPGSLLASLDAQFPFLSNFVVDACGFWDLHQSGRIRSGGWIQTMPGGSDIALEASAVMFNHSKILFIESCEYDHSEKQSMIQTGRLMALDLHRHRQQERFARTIRDDLEQQVETHTADLLQSNARLKAEIEERLKAERSLGESEHRFRILFDNLFDAQLLLDADGRIRDGNRAACRLMSCARDNLCGQLVSDLFPEHEVDKIQVAFATAARDGIAYIDETVLGGGEQPSVYIEGGGVGLEMDGSRHVVFSFRDISYRKQLQSQLQQAQKMEAMGTLASGISHDFNNILSAIIGYTEIVRMDLSETSQAFKNLNQVLAASNRAKSLVQQILTFSRQAEIVTKPVKVKVVIIEALKLIRATLPASITIQQQLESDSYVRCDPTQIHQICINLCSNAGHSMEDEGGILEVRLTDVSLDDGFVSTHPGIKPGPHIRLSVADTGKGISALVIGKVFDPFFTTKAFGKGTGMGLSVVHGIVVAAGGTIGIKNRIEKGCRFDVYLPIMDEPVADSSPAREAMKTGNECILFVDDEILQADLASQVLGRLGYEVVAKTNSTEALALFENDPAAFDLVITDLTMPRLSGKNLAKHMHALRPELPIILCSGFSSSITDEAAGKMGFCAYLKKPLVIKEMATAIRRALDEVSSA